MTLNKNEQLIAWVVGGIVGLVVLYFGVTGLFANPLEDYNKAIKDKKHKVETDQQILDKAKRLNADYEKLGIVADSAQMSARAYQGVTAIAGRYRMSLTSWTAAGQPRQVPRADFAEITYKATATGNTSAVAQFLYALETAGQPMRLDSLQMNAVKEGQDGLNITMTISALIYHKPVLPNAPAATRTASRGTRGNPAATAAAAKADADAKAAEAAMMARRAKEEQQLNGGGGAPASAPASAPAPETPEQAEAAMLARRAKEEQQLNGGGAPVSAPAATPASAPASMPVAPTRGGAQ